MKIPKMVLSFIAAYGLIFSLSCAAGDAARGKALFNDPNFDGDAARGKALFNDPNYAGAASGKSCNSCHPNGKGVEKAGDKKEFKIMGKTQNSLEEVVNFCIKNAIKGKGIDPKSDEMKDMVAYIKSLTGKMDQQTPGYK